MTNRISKAFVLFFYLIHIKKMWVYDFNLSPSTKMTSFLQCSAVLTRLGKAQLTAPREVPGEECKQHIQKGAACFLAVSSD